MFCSHHAVPWRNQQKTRLIFRHNPGEAIVAKNGHSTKKFTLLFFGLKHNNVIFFGVMATRVGVWKKQCCGNGLRVVRLFSLKTENQNRKLKKTTWGHACICKFNHWHLHTHVNDWISHVSSTDTAAMYQLSNYLETCVVEFICWGLGFRIRRLGLDLQAE